MYAAYFASLEARGIFLDDHQKSWYMKKAEVLGDDMKKEYPSTPEEAFETNINGLYYAAHISAARSGNRILNIPFDPTIKVHTVWDLGFTDSNSIICFQIAGKEIHIIDFIEGSGWSMTDYITKLKNKTYIYGTHLAPHDIKVHEYSTGTARFDTAAKLGIHFTIVPDISIADGIDSVRNLFPRLYFHNSDSVLSLVRHLENYTQKWDRQLGLWSGRPEHNEHSHASDAMRYLAVGLSFCLDDSQSMTQQEADRLFRLYGRR
ncbi:MAG TPA: hypothetical protein VKZ95_04375 [Sphingobacteriaceae bacterium]|nr:hypothetical protein [Sphingobacteriaceae bacterium]